MFSVREDLNRLSHFFHVPETIGESCKDDKYCRSFVYKGVCVNSACGCPVGYHGSASGVTCVETELSSPCTKRSDCEDTMPHTTCGGGKKCSCSEGYYKVNSKECTAFKLGDEGCGVNDCYLVKHSECVNKKCGCSFGYSATIDICTCDDFEDGFCIIIEIGVTPINATDNYLCNKHVSNSYWSEIKDGLGMCLCSEGYEINNNMLRCNQKGFNSTCMTESDCSLIVNATCSNTTNVCECVPGMSYDKNNSTCAYSKYTSTRKKCCSE